MRRGFTLVELSIVLVIIGLLIGGILAAQSMIETAKIQSVIRQIQQFDVAASNFNGKYNCLPGDCPSFGSGDGDNKIVGVDGLSNYAFAGEIANYWVQLQWGGFVYNSITFSNDTAGHFNKNSPTLNTPLISANGKGGVMVNYAQVNGQDGNYYSFAIYDDGVGTPVLAGGKPLFKPSFANAIDIKLDDGKYDTGNVSGQILYSNTSAYYANCGFGGTQYNLSSSNVECTLSVKLFSQTVQN